MFKNVTLAAMAPQDLAALMPKMTEREVERGKVLVVQGRRVETVSFPSTASLSNVVTYGDGRSVETFVMGTEGVTGLVPFLADAPCAWNVEVRSAGKVYEVPADALREVVDRSPALRKQLLRLASDYQAQAALWAACGVLHPATPRLAHFLLSNADRTESERLQFTQEDIAVLLGIQRTTVNASAKELKAAKAISYSRGKVQITDRAVLEAAACECYELERSLLGRGRV